MARHYSTRKIDSRPLTYEETADYRRQAARLEAVVDSHPDCVKAVTSDYRLEEMNLAGLEMIDAGSIDEVRGASVLDIVDPEYHEIFKNSIDATYRGETTEIEFTITGLKGSKRRMSQRTAPIFNSDNPNEVLELVAVTRDITAQHDVLTSLEEAKLLAEQANKVKSNFLATMSHEFRTPLNAILGFSEIIKSGALGGIDNEKYQEYVQDIHDSGRHLLDLINDVLDISEIEADKRVLLKEEIDLEEVVLHCLNTVNILAEKKEIMITVNVPANVPCIYADRRSMKQILINILSNSIKFSNTGDVVSLAIREEGEHILVEVKDDGVGISKENLKSITKPFFRGQADAEIAAQGTGLGLSIVKSLLEAHEGVLEIESTEHIGTTVRVKLPIYGG